LTAQEKGWYLCQFKDS